jgi:hypothetical protein
VSEELKSLEQEREKQERLVEQLDKEVKEQVVKAIDQAESEEFNVDDFLEPTDKLSKQLLDLIAEEQAYDDSKGNF